MSAPRTVLCRYKGCGRPFTSKHRLKEHVLEHLEIDPPEVIHQHAIIEMQPGGGWRVIKDLTAGGEGEGGGRHEAKGTESLKRKRLDDSDEIDGFRLKDILPADSQGQIGNITTTTTTTTTSGGTTSQPISFSPVLPDKPSQLSYVSQTPLRPYHSQPTASLPRSTQASGGPSGKPFVHSAPPKSTPSPTAASGRRGARIASSPLTSRHSIAGSQPPSSSSFRPDSQAISSTPRDQT